MLVRRHRAKNGGERAATPQIVLAALATATVFVLCDRAYGEPKGRDPEDPRGTLSLVIENDAITGQDRNYTNGVRASWLSRTYDTNGPARWIANNILRAEGCVKVRRGLALGHSIFTPADIAKAEPLPDQHPYAGWLYGEYNALIEQCGVVDQFTIQLGVVGPSAGGEWLQNEFHSLIGAQTANGWDNQIEDTLGLTFGYDRRMRALFRTSDDGWGVDLTPNFGVSAGTVRTNARAGLTLRLGEDLLDDYGPPRIQPALGGTGFFTPSDGFSWYVFAGIEGNAVAHDVFLDNSLFRDQGPAVETNSFYADAQFGVALQLRGVQIGFTFIERSRQYEGQDEPSRFGAFSLSRKL